MKHDQRKFYVEQITKRPITMLSIIINKTSFAAGQSLMNEKHIYFYATGELLKLILSWCSEQNTENKKGDGTVQLVFSNRSSLNCEAISEYCEKLFALIPSYSEMSAKHFRSSQVRALQHSAGLQIADALASSTYYSLQKNQFGHSEPAYFELLTTIMRKHGNEILRYGLIFIPALYTESGMIEIDVAREHALMEEVKKKAAIGPKDPTVNQTAAARNLD